jgi:putative transcriptional regulator
MTIQFFIKPKSSEVKKAKDRFAETVRDKRIAKGISQSTLAYIAGVDRKTINRIENGHFSPNLDTVIRLMTVLELSPNKLFKAQGK